MKTWKQFKEEQKIDKVQFLQKNGREFAEVNGLNLIIPAENFDATKEIYVIQILKDKADNVLTNVFALCNSTAKKTREL